MCYFKESILCAVSVASPEYMLLPHTSVFYEELYIPYVLVFSVFNHSLELGKGIRGDSTWSFC